MPKRKSQQHSDDTAKKAGRAKSLENLKPFKSGYDPRRNYHGRPRNFDELRDLVRDVGQGEVELVNGQKISRLYAKVLSMFSSNDPRDNALILQYGFGKVPDEINLYTWQNEVIQALKENIISPVDVIKTLGLEDAKPLLIAASATIPVDSPATEESSDIATDSTVESQ